MRDITLASIKELFPSAGTRNYAKGQIVCFLGDKPQHIFFVVKGHLKYYDIDEQGNEKILHLIGPNNIFPMMYAFDITKEVEAFYGTLETTIVLTVPLQEFQEAIETNISFVGTLTRWFLFEISELVYHISSLEKTDSRGKILHALKYLCVHYSEPHGVWQWLDIPVTHQFLADFTGLARETVSATMHELAEEKLIRLGKGRRLEIKRSELDKISWRKLRTD